MKLQNLEQTLTKKIEDTRVEVEGQLFKAWKKAKPEEREEIHAELRVLDKLIFRLIKSIRGSNG